ncbi:MAG TPA: hypothetical protein VJA21_17420 [Verrucomicrobiae bacterium]
MKRNQVVWLSCMATFAAVTLLAQPADESRSAKPSQSPPVRKQQAAARTNVIAAADYPVVGYIEKRGRTIIIKSGPKGAVYSVKTPEGKFLFENLSAEQLRAQAPDLHEFLKTAIAKDGSKPGTKADASLRLHMR